MAVVLIVDDDQRLAEMLREYLEAQGMAVLLAANGQQMRQQLAAGPVDVMVLDWMLPGQDGISLAKELRQKEGGPPILMLSARGEDDERILGLESGVDDYLAKPFNARELLARLRVLLRRSGKDEGADKVVFGDFRLQISERRLYREDVEVDINPAEMDLLLVFAQRPKRILSRDLLLQLLGGEEDGRFDRSIDVRVTRLRKILEENPRQPRFLQTERGTGYRFVPAP
ncbi:response regulator [Acidithiobacillus montserratensis]|uniref:Response regulator n=1 Tax=Acidithiobacillus montserratensis TaxID=2729135 RepID=A0ACD5HHC6_9PROT|nr:response regulator [Acidithiobacillus montserratensis]MBN2680037.1 response regulator [Acidithiobacillaceae bacterium]MBU2749374.1 response regulator [Acidithiobacillus montserratensis]